MAHIHQPYPAFSLDCPKQIIRMVSGRTVRAEIKLFAKCVWSIAGTGLGATIGEPDDVEPLVFGSDQVEVAQLEEAKAALEQVAAEGERFGAGEGEGEEAIDPVTLMLIQMAIQLFAKWIEKRRQGS